MIGARNKHHLLRVGCCVCQLLQLCGGCEFISITAQKQLLADEPVLRRSVELRNPYIDPLNYLQVEMLRRLRTKKLSPDQAAETAAVVELTINGISGGLKNTG